MWVLSARFNRSRWPSQPSASVGLLVGREWNIRYMKVFCEPQSTQHDVCPHCDWEKCWDDTPPGGWPLASLSALVQLLEVAAFLLCCICAQSGHRKRILNWLQRGRLLRGSFLLPPISFFISGCCCGNESCNLQTAASGDGLWRDDGAGLAESCFYRRGEGWFRAQIFWCPRGSVMRSNLSPAPCTTRGLHWHFWHFCRSGLLKGSCLEQASLWGPTWGPLGHSPTILLVILPQPTLNHLAGTVFPQIQQPCETNRAKLALLSIPNSRRKNLRVHLGKTSVPRQVSTDRNWRVISSIMPLQKEECCSSYSCINFYILCHT